MSALRDVKRAVTVAGDIASDVGFQNDVNALLATVARLATQPGASESDDPAPSSGLPRAAAAAGARASSPARRVRSAARR